MRGRFWMALVVVVAIGAVAAEARAEDKVMKFSVSHALKSKLAKEKTLDDVRVFMTGQGHPGVSRSFREYQSNKRSSGWNDQEACDKAFISAIIALQQRADKEGGNGVVDIYSIANNKKNRSADTYSCLRGRSMAQVILRGTVVRF